MSYFFLLVTLIGEGVCFNQRRNRKNQSVVIEFLKNYGIIVEEVSVMLENISDYLSFALLMAFPISLLSLAFMRLMHRRRARILANQEKYYREW